MANCRSASKRTRGVAASAGSCRGSAAHSKSTAPSRRGSAKRRVGVAASAGRRKKKSARPKRVNEGGEPEMDDLPDPTKIVSQSQLMFFLFYSLPLSGSFCSHFFGQVKKNRNPAAQPPAAKVPPAADKKPPPMRKKVETCISASQAEGPICIRQ